MMPAGWDGPVPWEGLVEDLEVRDVSDIEPTPVRQAPGTAAASDLIGQQTRAVILHSIVMRLNDAGFALIHKTDLVARMDRAAQLFVLLRRDGCGRTGDEVKSAVRSRHNLI